MKIFSLFLLIAFTLLYGCTNDSSSANGIVGTDTAVSQQLNGKLMADKMTAVYSYDSTYTDSTLVCRQWFFKDSLLKKWGEFHYAVPIESFYIPDYIISRAKGKVTYETFDSLICEVGGSSAWNKYVFTYDNAKKPVSVKHYKAWYENYDDEENPTTNSKPDYFLGEHTYFKFTTNKTEQITKDETGKIIEKITSVKDHQSRPVFEEWYQQDDDRFRIYYRYNNHPQSTAGL